MEALRRDASDAAEMLVARYRDRVLRLARRITRSEEDAEEVAQDALWTVVRKINSFRGEAALSTWVYRITANAALGKRRARKGKASEIGFDDLLPGVGGQFEPMDTTALPAVLRWTLAQPGKASASANATDCSVSGRTYEVSWRRRRASQ